MDIQHFLIRLSMFIMLQLLSVRTFDWFNENISDLREVKYSNDTKSNCQLKHQDHINLHENNKNDDNIVKKRCKKTIFFRDFLPSERKLDEYLYYRDHRLVPSHHYFGHRLRKKIYDIMKHYSQIWNSWISDSEKQNIVVSSSKYANIRRDLYQYFQYV